MQIPLVGLWNLLLGWTVIGWFHQLLWALQPRPSSDLASEPIDWRTPASSASTSEAKGRFAATEDHGARSEIAAALDRRGEALVVHEKSGVRVRVTLEESGPGYWIEVPTDSLDPRRGHRHRARRTIQEIVWRQFDGDIGGNLDPERSVDEDAETWGYSVPTGDSKAAADAALRLLCDIADLPIDVHLNVS